MMLLRRNIKVTVEVDQSFLDNLRLEHELTEQQPQKQILISQQQQEIEPDTEEGQTKYNILDYFDPRNANNIITTKYLKRQYLLKQPKYLEAYRRQTVSQFNQIRNTYKAIYQGTQNSIGDHIVSNPERERERVNLQKMSLYEDTRCHQIVDQLSACLADAVGDQSKHCEDQSYNYLYCMSQ